MRVHSQVSLIAQWTTPPHCQNPFQSAPKTQTVTSTAVTSDSSNTVVPLTSCTDANILSVFLLNATSLAKPNAVQLLETELPQLHCDSALITESWFTKNHQDSMLAISNYLRAVGRKVLWSSACVCVSVCLSVCLHCVCPQDISRTGSWITTKFGGWEQGVNL